jgi:tRNA G18 (ribose-2'-O)-methylase SpoU
MTAQTLVVTKRNSAFQLLQSLATNRQRRHATRSFLLEGVQPINTALRFGWQFAAVVVRQGARLSSWASETIRASGAPLRYDIAQDLLSELSGKDAPSELMAVVQMKDDHLERIPVSADLLVAVVDRPANPGNLGTLIRSCDAFGVQGLIVTGHAVDLYEPATIAASRGSLFAIPVARMPSHADVAAWVASVRHALGACCVVGTDEKGDVRLFDHDFRQPTVTIFGNETHGLSRAYREMCDGLVQIPMAGSASSLNVSIAASVVFYEIGRQRCTTT